MTFQSSIRLLSVEKLTPILKSFLGSFANGFAYPFSPICCNAASAVLSIFNLTIKGKGVEAVEGAIMKVAHSSKALVYRKLQGKIRITSG